MFLLWFVLIWLYVQTLPPKGIPSQYTHSHKQTLLRSINHSMDNMTDKLAHMSLASLSDFIVLLLTEEERSHSLRFDQAS